jgi:hypothetical protein
VSFLTKSSKWNSKESLKGILADRGRYFMEWRTKNDARRTTHVSNSAEINLFQISELEPSLPNFGFVRDSPTTVKMQERNFRIIE